jgi:hypothetical protein
MTAGADLRLLRTAVFTVVCVTLSAGGHTLTGGGGVPLWSLGAACAVVFLVALPLAGRERSLPGIAGLLAAGQVVLHTLFSCAPSSAPAAHSHASGGGGADLRSLAARLLCGEQSAGSISTSRAREVISDAGLDVRQLAGQASPSGHGGVAQHATGHGSHHHSAAGHGELSQHAAHHAAGNPVSAGDGPLECLRSAARVAVSSFDTQMLISHLVAAIVLGWFLRRGETALWKLVRLSARSVRAAATRVRALGTAVAYLRALRNGLLPDRPARINFASGDGDQRARRSVLLHHSVHRRGPPPQTRQESFALAA